MNTSVSRPRQIFRTLIKRAKGDQPAQHHPDDLHYLHIGKNAGTQIDRLFKQLDPDGQKLRFKHHKHRTKFGNIPRRATYFFSVRDPVTRFRSAFYSRKNKGATQTL